MISAPRITPPAMATSAPMPETRPERTPVVIIGTASSTALRAASSASSSMPSASVCSAALSMRRVGRGADLVGLVGHARTVATTTPAMRTSRPRTISRRARLGLSRGAGASRPAA